MTSPRVQVEVVCPRCQTRFRGSYRLSINLTLGEEWTGGGDREGDDDPLPWVGCGSTPAA